MGRGVKVDIYANSGPILGMYATKPPLQHTTEYRGGAYVNADTTLPLLRK
jgi:hypothetical protein